MSSKHKSMGIVGSVISGIQTDFVGPCAPSQSLHDQQAPDCILEWGFHEMGCRPSSKIGWCGLYLKPAAVCVACTIRHLHK